MYSPKIDEALIPQLYRLAKALNLPMTHLVNRLLAHGIARLEQGAENVGEPSAGGHSRKKPKKRRAPYGKHE